MTADLSAWLLEQITEDERRARAAAASVPSREEVPVGQRWTGEGGLVCGEPRQWGNFADYAPPLWDCEGSGSLAMPEEASLHIAAWDPARALAESDAKRRIVDLHSHTTEPGRRDRSRDWEVCDMCGSGAGNQGSEPWPCDTLKLLALPYSDRPGYLEGWRP